MFVSGAPGAGPGARAQLVVVTDSRYFLLGTFRFENTMLHRITLFVLGALWFINRFGPALLHLLTDRPLRLGNVFPAVVPVPFRHQ